MTSQNVVPGQLLSVRRFYGMAPMFWDRVPGYDDRSVDVIAPDTVVLVLSTGHGQNGGLVLAIVGCRIGYVGIEWLAGVK